MSLIKYLEKIDQIEDDEEFIIAEYDAIHEYCEDRKYVLTKDDLNTIKDRGLEESYLNWKAYYDNELE